MWSRNVDDEHVTKIPMTVFISFWILLKQETTGWQWHQLNHMEFICTSLQTDNHASTSSLHIFTGRMPFLPPNQQRQSTEGTGFKRSKT